MLRYDMVSPKLIVSRAARHFYRASACLSILLFVGWSVVLAGANIPEVIAQFAQPLLFVCVLGAASTLVGMEVFLFRFDNSPALKQIFWFCVMLFPLLGAPIYCFTVYSRSGVVKTQERAERASA